MRQYKHISGVPDKKDENGNWLKGFTEIVGDGGFSYQTRSFGLWKSINRRCTSQEFLNRFPSYKKVTMDFESYQYFAEWCQDQYGYMNREENGNYWSIDKDMLSGENKRYSPETCMFIPNRVNALLLKSEGIRGDLPLGVVYRKRNKDMTNELKNCYISNIKRNGKRHHLGYFPNPEEAHLVWQKAKVEEIEKVIRLDSIKNHDKLLFCLNEKADLIREDIRLGRETV